MKLTCLLGEPFDFSASRMDTEYRLLTALQSCQRVPSLLGAVQTSIVVKTTFGQEHVIDRQVVAAQSRKNHNT